MRAAPTGAAEAFRGLSTCSSNQENVDLAVLTEPVGPHTRRCVPGLLPGLVPGLLPGLLPGLVGSSVPFTLNRLSIAFMGSCGLKATLVRCPGSGLGTRPRSERVGGGPDPGSYSSPLGRACSYLGSLSGSRTLQLRPRPKRGPSYLWTPYLPPTAAPLLHVPS